VSRRLLVLRHGRTSWNATGRIQGQLDPPLDELGRAQAALAARTVAAFGPVAILSSDLRRTLEGARLLGAAASLPVATDPRLREINVGTWQGLTGVEAQSQFPDEYAAWRVGSDVRRGGGETYEEVGERAGAAALEFASELPEDGLGVLVTHGGTARSLIGKVLKLPVDSWWRLSALGNCCWAMLRESERGWRLLEYGVAAGSPDGDSAATYEAGPGAVPDVEPIHLTEHARP
jgi:probable phosphoglycerate mutase